MGTKMALSYANIFMGDLEKFIKLFIAMCPLHVNVIYKSEP
jgi:hypothetical protein